jgi:hypothetical protein
MRLTDRMMLLAAGMAKKQDLPEPSLEGCMLAQSGYAQGVRAAGQSVRLLQTPTEMLERSRAIFCKSSAMVLSSAV